MWQVLAGLVIGLGCAPSLAAVAPSALRAPEEQVAQRLRKLAQRVKTAEIAAEDRSAPPAAAADAGDAEVELAAPSAEATSNSDAALEGQVGSKMGQEFGGRLHGLMDGRKQIEAKLDVLRTEAAKEKSPERKKELDEQISRMQAIVDQLNSHFGAVQSLFHMR
mmetsp:Transcript_119917/g.208216  ORF Transcript_119917/g.208216 Transcript_119917/m.208216 type:complete len:164 (-) Transcript_119917:70-561(-)